MAKYKYTYQDWVEGKLDSPYISSGLVTKELLSQEDFNRILTEQGKAYSEYLNRRLQVLKKAFKYDYGRVLVKEEYIEQEENRVKAWLYHARKRDEYDILSTREYYLDGRGSLTKKDVDKYTSGDETFEDILGEVVWMHRLGGSKVFEENKRAHYIISSNYYKWLLWFKEKEALKEPSIEYVESSDSEVIEAFKNRASLNKSYNWQSKSDKEELPELYQRLIDKKLIAPATTLEQFKAVFTAKPTERIQAIEWIGGKALLAYFVDSIFSSGKIPISTYHWSVAEKCFTDSKELAKSKVSYEGNKKKRPKNFHLVDEALKGL